MDPPIHAEYLRSGGAMIFTFIEAGASGDLLRQAVGDASVHSGAARQHRVAVEVLTDVDVALHDRVVGQLVNAGRLHAEEGGLEERLGAAEALVANGDYLTVAH